MATRALQQVISYLAWNTSTNAFVTGDVANHSTSWSKDGTRSATTNSPAEVDATNLPGLYHVTMTATETDCIEGVLGGKSSTSNVVLIPTMVAFIYANTSAPAAAGVPDVNVKNINNVSASSVTTINANQGTTQPLNFSGTAGSALVKSDMIDIASAAVSTSSAQIGVNAVNIGGTAQTGMDIGASVLSLSQAFPSNFSSLSISAAGKINEVVLVDTLTTYTGNTPQTGDAYARLGAPAGASMSADIASVQTDTTNLKTRIPAALTGAGNMKSDALAVSGSTTAASHLADGATQIIGVTVGNSASTTSIPLSAIDISLTDADQLKGRLLIFDIATTTANLRGQATTITGSTTGATPTLTVNALTHAPASTDTGQIY